MFQENNHWLIQLHSFRSKSCDQFSHAWKRIAGFLDGLAKAAQVDLGDTQLATYLAERKPTGQPFFRNGLLLLSLFHRDVKVPSALLGMKETSLVIRLQIDLQQPYLVCLVFFTTPRSHWGRSF